MHIIFNCQSAFSFPCQRFYEKRNGASCNLLFFGFENTDLKLRFNCRLSKKKKEKKNFNNFYFIFTVFEN